MKYSASNGDSGTVYVDGKILKRVIECDTDEGTAMIFSVDSKGNLIVDHNKNEIVRQQVQGVITFEARQK